MQVTAGGNGRPCGILRVCPFAPVLAHRSRADSSQNVLRARSHGPVGSIGMQGRLEREGLPVIHLE